MNLPSWAFDPDNFDPYPPQELICSVCQSVMRDPVQSPCHHVFCRSCIYGWLKYNATCPICRKTLTLNSVNDIPVIKSLIMGWKLKCPYAEKGCAVKFTLENCNYHLRQCEYKPYNLQLTWEELQLCQPDAFYPTSLLKASSDKSLHHLISKILKTEKESINLRRGAENKEPPLLLALKRGCSLETVDVLLEAGAQVKACDTYQHNALHCAFLGNCPLPVIRKLLQCNKEMVRQKSKSGCTPLMDWLYNKCSLEIFRVLVEAGADLAVSCDYSYTCLHGASLGGCCKEILEEIIRQKPDLISHQNEFGRIPLHYASDEWVVKTLIEAGSDTGARDNSGNSPLQWALLQKDLPDSTISLFLDHMSTEKLRQVNNVNETLLHTVCRMNSPRAQLTERLMKLGIDPEKRNKEGLTALHLSAQSSYPKNVKELLRGHQRLGEIANWDSERKLAIQVAINERDIKEMIKWVSLQNVFIAKRMAIKNKTFEKEAVLYLDKCEADLILLGEHRVYRSSSLKDLLMKDYLKDIRVGLKKYVLALDFDANHLSVFREEVLEIQRKVEAAE